MAPAAARRRRRGKNEAVQRQAVVEGLGGANRVLTGQLFGDQQGLDRLRTAATSATSAIRASSIVDAAGGVEDQDVEARSFGRLKPLW